MSSCIDLHLHTHASDGSDPVPALVPRLRAAGIHTFSVTDHDTIDGTMEMEALVPPDLRFVRGIEFSCIAPGGKCHILGYGFDPENELFQQAIQEGRRMRRTKMEYRIGYLETHFNIRFTPEELKWLWAQNSPGKPHLADLIQKRDPTRKRDEIFTHFLKPTDGGNDRIPAELAIRGILSAGGVPVWAHPLGGENEDLTDEQFFRLLESLLVCGIQGLECHYSRYTPEKSGFLVEQARKHGLFISGGSDYHGSKKPGIHPGMLHKDDSPASPEELTILPRLFPEA